MKNPILLILVSYMAFILIIENNIFGVKYKVFFIIIDLIAFAIIFQIFNNTKFTKLGILLVLKIILFWNLFCFYDSNDFEKRIIYPKRELTLKVNIGNSVSNTKYYNNFKKAIYGEITSAPLIKSDLVGENIVCLFDSSEKIVLSNINITIKGILSENNTDKKTKYKLNRCIIMKIEYTDIGRMRLSDKVKNFFVNSFAKFESVNPEIRGFMHAIFLGDKTLLTNDQLNIFRNSGTLHLFAVSGLHIGFLYIIFRYSLRLILYKRILVEISVAIILLVYLEIIAYPPSAMRACIMIFFWQLSSIFFKKRNAFSSLCWSCLLVLIINPSSIISIGFQLSYTVVLTILIFNYYINLNIDRSIPSFLSFIKNSLTVSYSAFCGSLLLIYDHFDIIVPISILINIVAIPTSFIFIICIFTMLIFQNLIDVQLFGEVFLFLYNLLKSLIMLLSHENFSFFFIRNKVDLNNLVHFVYPIIFLIYFTIVKNIYSKVIGHLLLPIILIFLFSYIFV